MIFLMTASVAALSLTAALLLASWTPTPAPLPTPAPQRVAAPEGTQFNIQLLRPTGGPVIPIFEGWYPNADGTHELSFGYFNVNTEEVIEIPIGPDNFIEPAEFDGAQPTHFIPVPERDRRHYGVFTVNVPADFGDRDVVWTLRMDGQTFSVPGRLTSINYRINGWVLSERGSASPLLRLNPGGPDAQGPAGIGRGGLQATVSAGLPLTVWTTRSDSMMPDDTRPINVRWVKHRGPGDVSFSPREIHVETETWQAADDGAPATTQAMFGEPGDYVLRVVAYNTVGEFEFHCCWTNGYVNVTVTP